MYQRKTFFLTLLFLGAFSVYQQQFLKLNFNYLQKAQAQSINIEKDFNLDITEPKYNTIFSKSILKVKGVTEPNAEVFVNMKQLKADASGDFSAVLNLDEGQNMIVVVANDESGNYAEKEISVKLETALTP